MLQTPKEINQPSTSSDTDVCSIISNISRGGNSEYEENASSSKKCKLSIILFDNNEIISKEV